MRDILKDERADAIANLEVALEEIESGEGLSTYVEGHGFQSRVFRFNWREPTLELSIELPTGRVLSGEEVERADEAEAAAAIRMALVLLRVASDGKAAAADGVARAAVSCDETGTRYVLYAPDGTVIEEAEGWNGLVERLKRALADDGDQMSIIWP